MINQVAILEISTKQASLMKPIQSQAQHKATSSVSNTPHDVGAIMDGNFSMTGEFLLGVRS